jgi:hypothetical protein
VEAEPLRGFPGVHDLQKAAVGKHDLLPAVFYSKKRHSWVPFGGTPNEGHESALCSLIN